MNNEELVQAIEEWFKKTRRHKRKYERNIVGIALKQCLKREKRWKRLVRGKPNQRIEDLLKSRE